MGDNCFFEPDLPECQEPKPDEGGEGNHEKGGDGEMMETSDEMKSEMLWANVAFLLVALGAAVSAALDLFVYKWTVVIDGTDKDGAAEDWVYYFSAEYTLLKEEEVTIAYWRLGWMIARYGMLAIFGLATVTQALSMAGIAVSLNMMVWHWGVMKGGMILGMVVGIMYFVGAQGAWTILEEDADEADEVVDSWGAYAVIMLAGMKWDTMVSMAENTAATMTLMENGPMWMMAQWEALPEEERMEMEKEKEKGEKMFAFFGF